jgi:hypothetical protein
MLRRLVFKLRPILGPSPTGHACGWGQLLVGGWMGPAPTGLGEWEAKRSLHSCMEAWTDWMDVLSEVGSMDDWTEVLSEVGGMDDCRRTVGDRGGGG